MAKDIFSRLKSDSPAAYDALLEIRSNVLKTKEGTKIIKKNKALKDLVNFLHKPNEKILDVTLSILGNCCLDSDCRKEVVTHGIIAPLATVLHNIGKDSIQCRACRLIGNMAQDMSIAEQLFKEKIVAPIVSVLDADSNSSTATKQMAVRALRMLWPVEDHREEILHCQAVRSVTSLLPLNQEKREDQELLLAVVKALVIFSSHRSDECAQQVQGDGSSFQHLVSLIEIPSLKQSALLIICNLCYSSNLRPALGNVGVVKKIIDELSIHWQDNTGLYAELVLALCYLCRESVNRVKIRRAGGLSLMLDIIRTSSTPSLQPFVLHALIQFMYDEIGLQELLKEGLICVLVNKIGKFVKEHGKVHSQSSERPKSENDSENNDKTDYGYYINSSSQSREGSRASRAEKRCSSTDKEKEISRRRFRANSPSYQAVVQEQGISNRCSLSTYTSDAAFSSHCRDSSPDSPIPKGHISPEYTGDWSPGSPNSMCITPDASPPQRAFWACSPSQASDGLSPQPITPSPIYSRLDDLDCPEVYSPICCDPADDDEDGGTDHDECDNDDECLLIQELDEEKNKDSFPDSKQDYSTDGELGPALILLSRISYMDNPIEDLATCSTLTALLDYITLVENPQPRAQRILFRIIRNHHYFMSLLLQRFVLTVQFRLCQPQHSSCWICNEFKTIGLSLFTHITILAHSGFGEGELAYQLLKAESSVQKLLAVSIPYIVRIHRILRKLLMECGGLRTLMQILDNKCTEDADLVNYVPMSLKLLASALDIPNPYHRTEDTHTHDDKYPENLTEMVSGDSLSGTNKASDDYVFLLLDDGNTVQVSKSYLSLQSPMFEAMFRGDFKESSEKYVALPGVSHCCLINLLRIMKLGHVPSCIPDIDLNTSLELVAALDRFLIPGSEIVTEMIVARFLATNTAVEIYVRCMDAGEVSHFHTLRQETMRFMLTSNTTHVKNRKMFNDILQTSYKKQVLMDITDIFEERLKCAYKKPSRFQFSP